jgi:hypothetical protein
MNYLYPHISLCVSLGDGRGETMRGKRLMDRRGFLVSAAAATALPIPVFAEIAGEAPRFATANSRWQTAYDKALEVLAGNIKMMPYISAPVLIEGAQYQGIWQECGPHEALVYRKFRPDVARNSHMTFFELQRADGQLPANNKITETSFGQIQMVVPIAATAWELARATGDSELLEAAYRGCSAWDAWLLRWRNTLGTGLIEGFCTYDTGHDNSPRWKDMPNQCPNKDARRHHPIAALPRLCPDLSATVYGSRRALAAMAAALGKSGEADRWSQSADAIRAAILARLYVPEDGAFYDLDPADQFVRVRSDVISRVCGEHVIDQATFDHVWDRQLGNPMAFWAPFPLPSIALDDPGFVRPIPGNSWGGASQALTALRAPRWMEHYGRTAELAQLMTHWCEAIQDDPSMRQQIDPLTGKFTQEDSPGYSPCALLMVDFTARLFGVQETGDELHWNVRPEHPAMQDASFTLTTDGKRVATIRYAKGMAELTVDARLVARVSGGGGRLITDAAGAPKAVLGTELQAQRIKVQNQAGTRSLRVAPNQRIAL